MGESPVNLFGRKSAPAAAKPVIEPEPVAVSPETETTAAPAPVTDAVEPPTAQIAVEPEPVAPSPTSPASTSARLAFLDKGSAAMTSTPPKPPVASFLPGAAARADQPPRRVLDMPGGVGLGARRPESALLTPPPALEPAPVGEPQRRLVVGRDISLAGEIASCDVLVVEGSVEAKLRDGHSIEVAETGLFKGSVEIDDADIGGRFEGDIVVRNRLRVRSTGRIIGSIVYGELEVENGGRLVGSIKLYDPQPKTEVAAAPAPAFVASSAVEPAPDPTVSSDVQPAQVYVPPGQ
jgi:cytoskeletal protein CcmA (bactofilin family)